MAFTEQDLIALCRKQIEEKFAFGNGMGYTQRDLELLSRHIEEKTGVVLSLSTLKRLWKDDFKQRPQQATLDALAAVLDFRDWQDFKLKNYPGTTTSRLRRTLGRRSPSPRRPTSWYRSPRNLVTIGIVALLILGAYKFLSFVPRSDTPTGMGSIGIKGPVGFSAEKTVALGTPATVIFDYDLSHVRADSFFIQQSWNQAHRVAVDPADSIYTSIYYEAGYHRARLIANDSVLAMQPVHILSDGWEPYLYYSYQDPEPVSFRGEPVIAGGQLHLSQALLEKKRVDLSRPFLTRVANSQAFDTPSDNFSLVSRFRVDSVTNSPCPFMQVTVVTERHIFWVNLQQKGCEQKASYKMGEIIRFGGDNDLSALGVDLHRWQEIGISVKDKQAQIVLNGRPVFEETFREDFGRIKGLIYIFSGTGSLDHVRLAGAGGTVFEDDFGR